MTPPLRGQVAVVTGAGSGLGRSYAVALARHGAAVVVNDLPTSRAAADEVVGTIRDHGGEATTSLVSASDDGAGEALVIDALDAFGRLDIVVSNAGVLKSELMPDVSDAEWSRHRSVHLDGAFRLARAAWIPMAAQGYGRIVLTTSGAGLFGAAGLSAYGAAKMGIAGLVNVLAVEAEGTGIRVNGIAPLAWTPMSQAGGRTGSTAQILGPDTFARFAPEQVAEVVVLLCLPDCPAQGKVLTAGGGRVAQVMTAETRGYRGPALPSEELLRHWPEITAHDRVTFPASMREELQNFSVADIDD